MSSRGRVKLRLALAAWWRVTVQRWDSSFLSTLNVAVLFHVGLLVAAFLLDTEADARPEIAPASRFVTVDVRPTEVVVPPPPVEKPAAAMAGPAGTVGRPDRVEPTRVPRRAGPDMQRPTAMRALDLAMRSGALDDVFARDPGFSSKLAAAVGSGDDSHVGRGTGGFGLRGTGNGGGGHGGALMGLEGTGVSGGRAVASLHGTERHKVSVDPGQPQNASGFCREADILRVVQQHRQGISFCYEKALQTAPELRGKVTLRWTIGLDGAVVKVGVADDSLHVSDVLGCMQRAVQRWRFQPPDGGLCQIEFPFVFEPGA